MLTVTPKAVEKLKEALAQEGKVGYGLRVVAQPGGCACCGPQYALLPELQAQPDDTVLEVEPEPKPEGSGGLKLFIDPQSLELLRGATLDYVEHPELGAGFTIENPNADAAPANGSGGGCGCGGHGHGHGHGHGG